MFQKFTKVIVSTLALLASAHLASAHISYSGRNFGVFIGDGSESPVVITNQNVASEFGWAAGTDARFGDSHELRAFRFTLNNSAIVSITVVGLTYTAGQINFLPLEHPGFSVYGGLAHLPPNALDHDQSAISTAWLTAIAGSGNYDGAFNALGSWKIGSDDGTTFADLTSFTYFGNAADGTSANYGSVSGINGDGSANGSVTATFYLAAGTYSIFVGGGNYSGTSTASYGLQTTLTVVPEPSTLGLLGGAASLGALALIRRRPSVRG